MYEEFAMVLSALITAVFNLLLLLTLKYSHEQRIYGFSNNSLNKIYLKINNNKENKRKNYISLFWLQNLLQSLAYINYVLFPLPR